MLVFDAPQLQPGLCLDRYELLYPVAQGGMGAVWAARQRGSHGFEKLVALKTILPQHANDSGFRAMFLDEARLASRIEHKNVAQILDLGEAGGLVYLTMEWVNGDSLGKLQRLLGAERFPMGVLLRIFADACAGLHAAHELRNDAGELLELVHRDISPQNMIVSTQGTTKLIDFGVAKAKERLAQETNSGSLKGKFRFMAPEQVRKKVIDRRSDIWAMGVSLYYMLTGGYPIEGENETDVLLHLVSRQTLRPLPPEVPRSVAAVVEGALRMDPAERYATAFAMEEAIEVAIARTSEATTRDVAAYVAKRFADRNRQRHEALKLAQTALKERVRINGLLHQSTAHESTAESLQFHVENAGRSTTTVATRIVGGDGVDTDTGAGREAESASMRNPSLAEPPSEDQQTIQTSVLSAVFEAPPIRRSRVRWIAGGAASVALFFAIAMAAIRWDGKTTGLASSGVAEHPAAARHDNETMTAVVTTVDTTPPPSSAPRPETPRSETASASAASSVRRTDVQPRASAASARPPVRGAPKGDIEDAIQLRK